jgi:hypothetical protein
MKRPSNEPRHKPRRRTAMSFFERCELDADVEITALVNVGARAVNRNTKAYKAGYAHGVTAAREDGADFLLSAHAAGKADAALLEALGFDGMSRMLGVKKPLNCETPRKATLEFQLACNEYNAAYAAGWEAEEIAALQRLTAL